MFCYLDAYKAFCSLILKLLRHLDQSLSRKAGNVARQVRVSLGCEIAVSPVSPVLASIEMLGRGVLCVRGKDGVSKESFISFNEPWRDTKVYQFALFCLEEVVPTNSSQSSHYLSRIDQVEAALPLDRIQLEKSVRRNNFG